MAFSGEQMTPDQENVCEETAKKLFAYKQFGENFAKCECSAYPELCKELFKNRFLLDKVCITKCTKQYGMQYSKILSNPNQLVI